MKVVADIDRLFIYLCGQCSNQSDMYIKKSKSDMQILKKKKNQICKSYKEFSQRLLLITPLK
jgi:hypothetical protein